MTVPPPPDEPLVLKPLFKERVWGGRRLDRLGLPLPEAGSIGEAWLLADLPDGVDDGRTPIANGAWRGRPLHELLEHHRRAVLGSAATGPGNRFPLLVKVLDARENLSVQVHPTTSYARAHPGAFPKSEMWLVLDAAPGAVIYKGLRREVDRERFEASVRAGCAAELLLPVPARVGDCHYLPSGTCHALGAGVMVAEVQTPSDTTYRVDDWGRRGRELHVEAALACMSYEPGDPAPSNGAVVEAADGLRTERLVDTPHFAVERVNAATATDLRVVTSGQAIVLVPLERAATLHRGSLLLEVPPARAVVVPASAEGWHVELAGGGSLLRVDLPGPAEGLPDLPGTVA